MALKARREGKGGSPVPRKNNCEGERGNQSACTQLLPRTMLAWPWAACAGQCGSRLRSIPRGKSLEKGGGKIIQRDPLGSRSTGQVERQAERGKTDGHGDEGLHRSGKVWGKYTEACAYVRANKLFRYAHFSSSVHMVQTHSRVCRSFFPLVFPQRPWLKESFATIPPKAA